MKILMALTSHDKLGNTGRKTGFWLEEFAAPYYTFKEAGAEIVLASPKGGQPPLDPKSNEPNFQTDLTHRFEADADAKAQLATTFRLDSVKAEDFDTVLPWRPRPDVGSGRRRELDQAAGILPGCRQDLRVGLPLFRRAAGMSRPGRQAARRRQDRDRLHQWRGRRGRIDKGGPLLVEDELMSLGATFSKVKNWGVGRRRPADHRPESGLVGPGGQASDRYAEQEGQVAPTTAI
jgi:hypothetical protein